MSAPASESRGYGRGRGRREMTSSERVANWVNQREARRQNKERWSGGNGLPQPLDEEIREDLTQDNLTTDRVKTKKTTKPQGIALYVPPWKRNQSNSANISVVPSEGHIQKLTTKQPALPQEPSTEPHHQSKQSGFNENKCKAVSSSDESKPEAEKPRSKGRGRRKPEVQLYRPRALRETTAKSMAASIDVAGTEDKQIPDHTGDHQCLDQHYHKQFLHFENSLNSFSDQIQSETVQGYTSSHSSPFNCVQTGDNLTFEFHDPAIVAFMPSPVGAEDSFTFANSPHMVSTFEQSDSFHISETDSQSPQLKVDAPTCADLEKKMFQELCPNDRKDEISSLKDCPLEENHAPGADCNENLQYSSSPKIIRDSEQDSVVEDSGFKEIAVSADTKYQQESLIEAKDNITDESDCIETDQEPQKKSQIHEDVTSDEGVICENGRNFCEDLSVSKDSITGYNNQVNSCSDQNGADKDISSETFSCNVQNVQSNLLEMTSQQVTDSFVTFDSTQSSLNSNVLNITSLDVTSQQGLDLDTSIEVDESLVESTDEMNCSEKEAIVLIDKTDNSLCDSKCSVLETCTSKDLFDNSVEIESSPLESTDDMNFSENDAIEVIDKTDISNCDENVSGLESCNVKDDTVAVNDSIIRDSVISCDSLTHKAICDDDNQVHDSETADGDRSVSDDFERTNVLDKISVNEKSDCSNSVSELKDKPKKSSKHTKTKKRESTDVKKSKKKSSHDKEGDKSGEKVKKKKSSTSDKEKPKTKKVLPLTPAADDCEESWDSLFDDNGDCLNDAEIEELAEFVGKVEIDKPKINYLKYQPKEPDFEYEAFSHIIEIYDFPPELATCDLISAFREFSSRGFDVKWVDDTHALGVFSSAIAASEALNTNNPILKVRPMSQASKKGQSKARHCQEFLQPYKARPETTSLAARRLVAGALGMAPKVSREMRDAERQKLKDAKDKRRQAKQQKVDIWDGTVGSCAMDE